MKLKVFPYEGMASCMHLILIYHVIVTKASYLTKDSFKPPCLSLFNTQKEKLRTNPK